jgi:hypothetical protein
MYQSENNELGIRVSVTLLYETTFPVTNEKVREIYLKFSGIKCKENPISSFRVVTFYTYEWVNKSERAE